MAVAHGGVAVPCRRFHRPRVVLTLLASLSRDLAQELSALLAFLSSLNAVLWYDTPALRDLVILDPQARDVGV